MVKTFNPVYIYTNSSLGMCQASLLNIVSCSPIQAVKTIGQPGMFFIRPSNKDGVPFSLCITYVENVVYVRCTCFNQSGMQSSSDQSPPFAVLHDQRYTSLASRLHLASQTCSVTCRCGRSREYNAGLEIRIEFPSMVGFARTQ